MNHVALCDRMGVTWQELQETPAMVVDDYMLVMEAEAREAERRRKKGERR